MKKFLFLIFFLFSLSAYAWDKCDTNYRTSNTDRKVIEKIVKQKNDTDKNQQNSKLTNKAFDIAFLDFGDLNFSRQGNLIQFWEWITDWWLDGWSCHYPVRKYSIMKGEIYTEKSKYPKNHKLTFQELLSEFQNSARYNLYADDASGYSQSWTLVWGSIVYETGTINGNPYIVQKNVWEFDGSVNYTLWLVGKKYNYQFQWPHNNQYADVEKWKSIIKSIKFFSK